MRGGDGDVGDRCEGGGSSDAELSSSKTWRARRSTSRAPDPAPGSETEAGSGGGRVVCRRPVAWRSSRGGSLGGAAMWRALGVWRSTGDASVRGLGEAVPGAAAGGCWGSASVSRPRAPGRRQSRDGWLLCGVCARLLARAAFVGWRCWFARRALRVPACRKGLEAPGGRWSRWGLGQCRCVWAAGCRRRHWWVRTRRGRCSPCDRWGYVCAGERRPYLYPRDG